LQYITFILLFIYIIN